MIPRPITCVLLEMTTHCDQRCPNCCAGVGINRFLQHHSWEYFERAAAVLYGIERIHLTGGEPTIHPDFAEFVPRFKELFGCQRLTIQTDGYRVLKHAAVISSCIDEVFYSDYHNRPTVARTLVTLGPKLSVYDAGRGAANHAPRSRRGSGQPCERAFGECVLYADGKLYGCCVAAGVDGAVGIEPGPGWKVEVRAAALPCHNCWFSPEAA